MEPFYFEALMSIKTAIAKFLAKRTRKKLTAEALNGVELQLQCMQNLISTARDTDFGKDHGFGTIQGHEDFAKQIPIRDYEALKAYVDRVVDGDQDVLWPGQPIYFAKTSGTTSGAKFIPITKDSISNHINSARNMLLCYVHQKGNADFLNGKLIFLQGSPELKKQKGVHLGRLSGIVAHHVPGYLQRNRLPSMETNCIDDWEQKLDAVIDETLDEDMTLISGIPPWVQMYFDRLTEKTGKKVGELFPNFNLMVHGGVNFAPYKSKLIESIGREVDILETYPASEGFIAFQDNYEEEGLLLNVNSGIFFEFIPVADYHNEKPRRLHLGQVEVGENYAVIINSNAGLWGYSIGDTVKFISKAPYKLVVTGRIKHFISAFGEHVIAQEVADSLANTALRYQSTVLEFTVAPQVNPEEGLPYHEWFIEFDQPPTNMSAFAKDLDTALCQKNSYYDDLISGSILRPLIIREMQPKGFQEYMKSKGKLGGQNKVPKLSNNREMADDLSPWLKPG